MNQVPNCYCFRAQKELKLLKYTNTHKHYLLISIHVSFKNKKKDEEKEAKNLQVIIFMFSWHGTWKKHFRCSWFSSILQHIKRYTTQTHTHNSFSFCFPYFLVEANKDLIRNSFQILWLVYFSCDIDYWYD